MCIKKILNIHLQLFSLKLIKDFKKNIIYIPMAQEVSVIDLVKNVFLENKELQLTKKKWYEKYGNNNINRSTFYKQVSLLARKNIINKIKKRPLRFQYNNGEQQNNNGEQQNNNGEKQNNNGEKQQVVVIKDKNKTNINKLKIGDRLSYTEYYKVVENNNYNNNITFLIDDSGSMSGNRINTCKKGLIEIIKTYLNNKFKISLMRFGTLYNWIFNGRTKEYLLNNLGIIENNLNGNSGRTFFYTALTECINRAKENDWICALTDGAAHDDKLVNNICNLLKNKKLNIIIISIDLNEYYKKPIRQIIDSSNGLYIDIGNGLKELSNAFKVVGKKIKSKNDNSNLKTLENVKKEKILVSENLISNHFYNAHQYNKTERVGKMKMAKILENSKNIIFQITFHKMPTPQILSKNLQECKIDELSDPDKLKKKIKSIMLGEKRVLVGYLLDTETNLGRSSVIDLNIELIPGQPTFNRAGQKYNERLVDHRTIKELIVKNIRYVTY